MNHTLTDRKIGAYVEGQWVRDGRCTEARIGQVTVAGLFPWIQVTWTDDRVEQIHDLTEVTAVAGPVGDVKPVVYRAPQCPYDRSQLEQVDDGWHCPVCRTWWNVDGDNGQRTCALCNGLVPAVLVDITGRPVCADHSEGASHA